MTTRKTACRNLRVLCLVRHLAEMGFSAADLGGDTDGEVEGGTGLVAKPKAPSMAFSPMLDPARTVAW